jgi:hypothetical protein
MRISYIPCKLAQPLFQAGSHWERGPGTSVPSAQPSNVRGSPIFGRGAKVPRWHSIANQALWHRTHSARSSTTLPWSCFSNYATCTFITGAPPSQLHQHQGPICTERSGVSLLAGVRIRGLNLKRTVVACRLRAAC